MNPESNSRKKIDRRTARGLALAVGALIGVGEVWQHSTTDSTSDASTESSATPSRRDELLAELQRRRSALLQQQQTESSMPLPSFEEQERHYDETHNAVTKPERELLYSELFAELDKQSFQALRVGIKTSEYIEYLASHDVPAINIYMDRQTGFYTIALGFGFRSGEQPKQLDETAVVQILVEVDKKVSSLDTMQRGSEKYQDALDEINDELKAMITDPNAPSISFPGGSVFRDSSGPDH